MMEEIFKLNCGKKLPPGERWSNNARQKNIEERDIIEGSTKTKKTKK